MLDSRLKGGFYAEHEDPDQTVANDKFTSWVLFIVLVGSVIFFWDDIKEWFWTSDFTSTRCVSRTFYDPADFPESKGWVRYEPSIFERQQAKYSGKICYKRTYKNTEVIDERFQPDPYKTGEGQN